MAATAAFGLDAGGGFIVGASLVFMFLSLAVLLSREIEHAAYSEDILKAILASVARGGAAAEANSPDGRDLERLLNASSSETADRRFEWRSRLEIWSPRHGAISL
jgi:hypothetical protein